MEADKEGYHGYTFDLAMQYAIMLGTEISFDETM